MLVNDDTDIIYTTYSNDMLWFRGIRFSNGIIPYNRLFNLVMPKQNYVVIGRQYTKNNTDDVRIPCKFYSYIFYMEMYNNCLRMESVGMIKEVLKGID